MLSVEHLVMYYFYFAWRKMPLNTLSALPFLRFGAVFMCMISRHFSTCTFCWMHRAPATSLGDIQNMPTFWVLAFFGNFYNFCFHVQTCRHLGGGYVYTF